MGHVRVYHGELSKLPRHYVPRERFYLRATGGLLGKCAGRRTVLLFQSGRRSRSGAGHARRSVALAGGQRLRVGEAGTAHGRRPTGAALHGDLRPEGYSPDLFRELQPQRIAALTYHRYPDGEDWRAEEFQEQAVKLVSGQTVRMKLAERGTHVGKRPGLWVREVRKLGTDGHQVSIVSTNFSGRRLRKRPL